MNLSILEILKHGRERLKLPKSLIYTHLSRGGTVLALDGMNLETVSYIFTFKQPYFKLFS